MSMPRDVSKGDKSPRPLLPVSGLFDACEVIGGVAGCYAPVRPCGQAIAVLRHSGITLKAGEILSLRFSLRLNGFAPEEER